MNIKHLIVIMVGLFYGTSSRKYYFFNYCFLKNTGLLIIKGTIFNIAGYIY